MREATSISLPDDLKADLDRYSEEQGNTRSDTVRKAIKDYLFVRRFRDLRGKMLAFAEAQGIFTDEDVYRMVS